MVASWPIFYMALRTGSMEPENWEQYFVEAGISPHSAKIHAVTFANEKLSIGTLQMMKEQEVISMGEALCILKQAKEATPQATYVKALTAKLPQLNMEMTPNSSGSSRLIGRSLLRSQIHKNHRLTSTSTIAPSRERKMPSSSPTLIFSAQTPANCSGC